jgi:UDP-glucose-4-epimerase GalE
MRVLVTGGAGYVGSTTAQRLIDAGHEVVVIDSLELGHRDAVPEGATLVPGDISDRQLVEAAVRDNMIEAVLHCAGYSLVGESVQQPQRYFDNNVAGGVAFLDALLAAGIERVVFSSSAAVYGAPARVPIEETDALAPINPYGATKLAVENALTAYAAAYGWSVFSLRYFNAAGATDRLGEDHRPETHLIPNILAAVERDTPVRINGSDYPTPDGTCVRDYIHVDDLAAAHRAALERTATAGPGHVACNLGSGSGFSNLEILRAAEAVVGHEIRHEMADRRPGDPPVLVASNGRARELLDWEPRHGTLEEIVGSAWAWRQSHPGGYAG